MKKRIFKCLSVFYFFLFSFSILLADEKPATELNKTVKTEGLSGLNLFLAQTYNNNRLLYAIISTSSVVILGVIITYIIGFFIKPHKNFEKHE